MGGASSTYTHSCSLRDQVSAAHEALNARLAQGSLPRPKIGDSVLTGPLIVPKRPEDAFILSTLEDALSRRSVHEDVFRVIEIGAGGSAGGGSYGTPFSRVLMLTERFKQGDILLIATDPDVALCDYYERKHFNLMTAHVSMRVSRQIESAPFAGKSDFVFGRHLGALSLSNALEEFGLSRLLLRGEDSVALLCFECIYDVPGARMILLKKDSGSVLDEQGHVVKTFLVADRPVGI
jgi:hypothetical protein